MFYQTSKFHVNRVNTFRFMERGGSFEGPPSRPRNSKKAQAGANPLPPFLEFLGLGGGDQKPPRLINPKVLTQLSRNLEVR